MLFKATLAAMLSMVCSCSSVHVVDTTKYQATTFYGRSDDGLPVQYFSFYLVK